MSDYPIEETRFWNLCNECDHEWYSRMDDEACPNCGNEDDKTIQTDFYED